MNKIILNNTDIELIINEIINTDLDAIVVPSNSRLLPSGTLRCKILREAGPKIQIECNRIINKIANIPIGKAVMTMGGELKAKRIIHVVGPRFGKNAPKQLMLATWNSLKIGDEVGLSSLAFNPISIENLGFNTKICAEVMLPTMKKYLLEKNKNLKKIGIYLTDLPEYKDFEDVLDGLIA
ncbi:MAG: hypothetical protein EU540_00640 [Promethearchaeota archaeon]|nr:MAG: hypothetical protein EU540_00640 [Candidatus Lokiarchaeota archaeon]